ncbi:MAG: Radical SAM domain protein [Parcubacteria group bacterium GW2011_GWC1_38_6]|nr:MAG: Radical SAM domain protein [Parcubacteria group bacterium GW2011_GWC1_38_6]
MPNVLLVYPKFPKSFWGMNYALPFVGRKSTMPPLGLLTIAGMFPPNYNLKLVDINTRDLTNEDLRWADVVFTSAMIVQKKSLNEVISRCKKVDVPIVVGGPYPTTFHDEILDVNYFLLGEVEEIFLEFLDRESQQGFKREGVIYRESGKPDLSKTPLPRFDLINFKDYESMCLQFSRGCPYDCEFCDITKLYGRNPRTKSKEQMFKEFQLLYDLGWRGRVFLVDDNFIGRKNDAMQLLLDLAGWQRKRRNPFYLYTEASIDLAKYPELLDAMVEANFSEVFVGIETPNREALLATRKRQNVSMIDDGFLLRAVSRIQSKGLEVMAGFILGLDSDSNDIFDAMKEFIRKSGIPVAMVGLLGAVRGTDLYKRLCAEGRIVSDVSGDNLGCVLNFKPEMNEKTLLDGYREVLSTIYDPGLRNYFKRCLLMLDRMGSKRRSRAKVGKAEIKALFKSLWKQLLSRQGIAYGQFLATVLIRYPKMLPDAVRFAIIGYHLEKITREIFNTRKIIPG